ARRPNERLKKLQRLVPYGYRVASANERAVVHPLRHKRRPIAGFRRPQRSTPCLRKTQAMTAFQVNPIWYDEYWLRDTNDFTGPQVRRCAKRERHLAIKHAPSSIYLQRLFDFFGLQRRRTNDQCPLWVRSGRRLSAPQATWRLKTGRRNRVGPG